MKFNVGDIVRVNRKDTLWTNDSKVILNDRDEVLILDIIDKSQSWFSNKDLDLVTDRKNISITKHTYQTYDLNSGRFFGPTHNTEEAALEYSTKLSNKVGTIEIYKLVKKLVTTEIKTLKTEIV